MKHEIVVFGATSFVGRILCRHLAEQFGAGELDWAAAGRSPEKLDKLRATLADVHQEVPLIVADAADEAALRELASKARVVISTVGPYAVYGEPLVKICAESGTDYCDLTGEVQVNIMPTSLSPSVRYDFIVAARLASPSVRHRADREGC